MCKNITHQSPFCVLVRIFSHTDVSKKMKCKILLSQHILHIATSIHSHFLSEHRSLSGRQHQIQPGHKWLISYTEFFVLMTSINKKERESLTCSTFSKREIHRYQWYTEHLAGEIVDSLSPIQETVEMPTLDHWYKIQIILFVWQISLNINLLSSAKVAELIQKWVLMEMLSLKIFKFVTHFLLEKFQNKKSQHP